MYCRGVARESIRFASRSRRVRLPEKIPVQLLKNVANIGVAGQVIRVKPAFMRNFLHVSDKAAYILKGEQPPLPVVKKEAVAPVQKVVEEAPKETVTEEKTAPSPASAMSLDELSSLFKNMRHSKRSPASKLDSVVPNADISFTLSELKETIPHAFTIKTSADLPLPLDKGAISAILFDLSGVNIPHSLIKVSKEKNIVDSITSCDTYDLIITSTLEKSSLSRTIIVE